MKKVGAIDIGTNSMRILLAQVENGCIIESFKDLRTTRIGEHVDKTGQLSVLAIQRNIQALKEFINIAQKEGITQIPIIATSAVRDAKNREVLIKQAKEEIDAHIDIITGEKEAQLGFTGVLRGLKEKDKNILVIDIGGGSTEFIFGNKEGIKYLISINVGAVRMTERFVTTDPICKVEIEELVKNIDEMMKSTINYLCNLKIDKVIGIGGTATTIAAVSKELEIYDKDMIHHVHLSHEQVKDICNTFLSKNLEERKRIKGLQPKRADIITSGTIILDRILTNLGVEDMIISEYDNLEGLVFEQLENK
ncbi:Ppx/GppA phosphatase family protein [Marinisporobacter balticus]|uniref:Exopolyphosphatase/guanosine-5'-triphosphate, 3'-diphosphate pyrophosphatase n=1 Tax=Marinisporobacter balticus TaxID=2018667 RepID=A0A4R2KMR5_9FIRM|nr:Ppx/GppA phosphatase family protein [Marinisporobacter balticus]TCO71358.1 exopolyphosphatase/guanosine-5'-triphosphate,3'-diphosphate pyrophosphatase [Marinisporobacter balticus]